MVEEEEIHAHHVLDGNEIAQLLARPEPGAPLEELHPARGEKLVEEVESDRSHAALVGFAGPVDVEVAEAREGRRLRRQPAANRLVEEELGVAVHVERRLVLARLAEYLARAIHRRRRSVDEEKLARLAPLHEA